jgi:hypothetical protein
MKGGCVMPEKDNTNNSYTSEIKAEFTNKLTVLSKNLLGKVFERMETEATSVIEDPEKRKELVDKAKQILKKSDVQKDFEELLHEAYWKDGLNKDSVVNSLNLTIHNTLQDAYNDGRMDGYHLMMMGLIENNAPKELLITIKDYFRHNFGGHFFENRRKVREQYEEMMKHYNEAKK